VHLFHQTVTGGFLLLAFGKRKLQHYPLSYYTYIEHPPLSFGNRSEQHIQPIENKEYERQRCTTDSDWSENFRKQQAEISRWLL
jgi:hypothetical protein